MYYTVYVIGEIFLVLSGIGFYRDLRGYADSATAFFVVLPCILLLFSTKSFKAFGRSLLFAFGKRDYSLSECRESFQAVRMVLHAVLVLGAMGFLISMINSIRGWELLSFSDELYWCIRDLAVAMLGPFYSLAVCLFFLPVFFMLKKHLDVLEYGNAGGDPEERKRK